MIRLYRKGTTHTVRGIECEMKDFNERSFKHELENGWFFTPEEAYGKVDEPEPEDDLPTITPEEEIRQKGKDAGIRNWQDMRIDKLEKKLSNLEE